MGLGKTVQAIAYAALHDEFWPVLVVCPANVKYNWKKEATKWLPNESVHVVDSGKATAFEPADIIVINYDLMTKKLDELLKMNPRLTIIDEAHYLKNEKAKRTIATMTLARFCPKVIALSGTAIASRPKEFFNALNLMRPEQFASFWDFAQRYCDPWYDGWARGPNNADGTMGDILTNADGTNQTIEENWYDDSVKTNPDGSIMLDDDDNPVRYFPDGADMQIEMEVDGPDGIPDNPGQVVWKKPVRTDMTANNNFNLGLSATLSLPLDKKLQRLCKQAATTQIEQQAQITANKRLDFEIARLKNCGELMQKGIMFHPKSPYAAICADVVVSTPPGTIIPHAHNLARPTFKEDTTSSPPPSSVPSQPSPSSDAASQNLSPTSPSSSDTHSSSTPLESDDKESSQASSGWLRWPFSRQASPPSEEDQPAALLGGPIQLPPSQSLP